MLDLESGVAQAEAVAQERLELAPDRVAIRPGLDEHVRRYRGMNIVPSWGGSMFEARMVPLLVPEASTGSASTRTGG